MAILATIALGTSSPQPTLADGIYIPDVAHPELPSIPRQTALIVQHGTTQTWIIESPVDATSLSLGWIIPVPTIPTKIEKASPAVLRTLENITWPRIVFSRHDLLVPIALAFLSVPIIILSLQLASKKIGLLIAIGSSITVGVLLAIFILPGFGESGPQTIGCTAYPIDPTTQEFTPTTATSFESTVLAPKGIADIDKWLAKRGLCPVPGKYRSALAGYITRKWFFVATHITRSASGLNTPPPIKITFNDPNPVFPATLFPKQEAPPPLLLFLLSDEPHIARGLRTTFRDRFYAFSPESFRDRYFGRWLTAPQWNKEVDTPRPDTSYLGHESGHDRWLVQPELAALTWHCSVLTRFTSSPTHPPSSHDITLNLSPSLLPMFSTVFSESGAIDRILTYGIATLCCSLFIFAVLERTRKPVDRSIRRWFVRNLAAGGTLTILGFLVYTQLPIVPVSVRYPPITTEYWCYLPHALSDAAHRLAQPSLETLSGEIQTQVRRWRRWDRHPIRFSDDGAPGDIRVVDHGGRLAIRYHDHNGLPIEIPVPPKPGPPNTSR